MKKISAITLLLFYSLSLAAQDGETVFSYLLLPSSARGAALGGYNVSVVENDLPLIYMNPALLREDMDMTINANYLSYIGDIGVGSATFAKTLGEKSVWGVGFNFANYGKMLETTQAQDIVGDLNANDICGNLFFSRDLTETFRGGIAAKLVYSNYSHNTAIGLGVDLGINYYNPETELSIGIAGKNLGRQVKSYEDELSNLPWNIQLGMSQRLNHAPIRYSITLINLNHLRESLMRHFVFGVELMPSDNFWIAAGYNTKRASDLSLTESNKMGGFSVGAGLKVKAFSIGCSAGIYHPSATSVMVSLSTSLSDFGL
ncbi:MAG: type IX secretion system protein PorQ [Dysgonamonadaceae bacterium]|jgi:hypothetical protein|nr:type IX secretion system protein PorQ [Dysgonamonadaceae bacterium]